MNLFPYQENAVNKMFSQQGFLLADEMGMGKTVTVLAELSIVQPNHTLIVCPKSVMGVWEEHCREIIPNFNVTVMPSPGTPKSRERAVVDARAPKGKPSILIVSWSSLNNSKWLFPHTWDYIIADEAHYIKNRDTQRTRKLKALKATRKRALTGTPVINRPDELWSILNWLDKKTYRGYWNFFNEYVDFDVNYFGYKEINGPKNSAKLRSEIAPFFLQRYKKDHLKELPPKYYTTIKVPLSPQQRRIYKDVTEEGLSILENEGFIITPTVLAQLTRLRQIALACLSQTDDGEYIMTDPSTKIDALMDIMEGTDKPLVVFTTSKKAVDLISKRLTVNKVEGWETITGDTNQDERKNIVTRFQGHETMLLICTMQTAGYGITLTAADTAVFMDRDWSPAINAQAEDRLHRVGQSSAVQIIKLHSPGTIDDHVEGLLNQKGQWLKRLFGEGKGMG